MWKPHLASCTKQSLLKLGSVSVFRKLLKSETLPHTSPPLHPHLWKPGSRQQRLQSTYCKLCCSHTGMINPRFYKVLNIYRDQLFSEDCFLQFSPAFTTENTYLTIFIASMVVRWYKPQKACACTLKNSLCQLEIRHSYRKTGTHRCFHPYTQVSVPSEFYILPILGP